MAWLGEVWRGVAWLAGAGQGKTKPSSGAVGG